jgi:hypothetical protein
VKLKFFKGKKHKKDVVSVFVCDCGRKYLPTFEEIVTVAVLFARNEDVIYPKSRGFQGGDMFYRMIKECMERRIIPDKRIKEKYMLEGRCPSEDIRH